MVTVAPPTPLVTPFTEAAASSAAWADETEALYL